MPRTRAERLGACCRDRGAGPSRWRLAAVSAALTLRDPGRVRAGRRPARLRPPGETTSRRAARPRRASSRSRSQLDRQAASADARPNLDEMAMADARRGPGRRRGRPAVSQTAAPPRLGPPTLGVRSPAQQVSRSRRRRSTPSSRRPGRLRPVRPQPGGLEATIDRLWLFLAGGVLAGTAAGGARRGCGSRGRAMRPIASLTATAREIASTRDPPAGAPARGGRRGGRAGRDPRRDAAGARRRPQRDREAMQAQREFVADASHELRTPLTSILANLELLQASLEGVGARARTPRRVASALRSSQRMRRLVSDLLLLARADAGRAGARDRVRPRRGRRRGGRRGRGRWRAATSSRSTPRTRSRC